MTTNRKTNKPKTSRQTQKVQQPQHRSTLIQEVVCIGLIAIGLLLVLSLYTTTGAGALGSFFNGILKGLFGFGAYLLPLTVISASLIILFSKQKYVSMSKIIMSCFLFWIVICFVHVLNMEELNNANVKAWDYVSELYITGGMTNGGFFGGILANFLDKIIGRAGTFIFLIFSFAVLLIIVSGKSLFSFVLRIFSWVEEKVSDIRELPENDDEYDDYEEEEKPRRKTKSIDKHEYDDYERKPHAKGKKLINWESADDDSESDEHTEPSEQPEHPTPHLHLITDDIKNRTRKSDGFKPFEFKKPSTMNTVDSTALDLDLEEGFIQIEEPESGTGETGEVTDSFGMDIEVRGMGIIDAPSGTRTPLSVMEEELPKSGKKSKETPAPIEEVDEWIKEHEQSSDALDSEYVFPPINLLRENTYSASMSSKSQILENSRKLEETLKSFGVEARVVEVSKGPAVTRYELSPGVGVKVSKISGLADDLALNLAAVGIRIEAPIPGKAVVGIEIPNKEVQAVYLKEVIDDEAFEKYPSKLAFAVGKDIAGNVVIADIGKMPHLLIAGSTGSGKSVCINTIITSILYKSNPEEVKLLMIDPKVVELSIYNGIPHLLIPVVTDPKKAAGALNWAVQEMDARYNLFAETFTRDLKGFNTHLVAKGEPALPQIVIIIDELADLMMTAPGDVESAICRIAQKARAAGIHLVIATQRPSVDVITGLIKTNVPSRLAFAVASGIDSRTILDMTGAEKLLGKGDMLFNPVGVNKPQRIQGAFISDKEVENIVNFIKKDYVTEYDPAMVEKITNISKIGDINDDSDEFFEEAIEFLVEKEKASVSMLQRRFRIGYNRAANLMEDLEKRGIVGSEDGSKPRKVLMSAYQWDEYKQQQSDKI